MSLLKIAAFIFFATVCIPPPFTIAQSTTPSDKTDPASAGFVSEEWRTENGLPINIINQVHQTPNGYLWMATFNGLIRFDGVEFKELNAGNSPSLVSNRILSIQSGIDNNLWLNTEQKTLIKYSDGTFTPFENLQVSDSYKIFPEKDSTWVATSNGLYINHHDLLTPYLPEYFSGKSIQYLFRANDRSLWIFSDDGSAWQLQHIQSNLTVTEFNFPIQTNTAFEDSRGRIWIGGDRLGYLYNGKFYEIDIDPLYLEKWNGDDPVFFQFDETTDQTILASSERGLFQIKENQLTAIDLRNEISYKSLAVKSGASMSVCPDESIWSVVDNRVYQNQKFRFNTPFPAETIFCDREQNIWVSTFQNGLIRYRLSNLNTITFNHSENNFYGIYSDSYSGTWIGGWFTDLTHISPDGSIEVIDTDFPFGTTASFAEDSSGTLYIGFNRCRAENRTASGGCNLFEKIDGLEEFSVFSVTVTEDQTVWFGTNEGAFKLQKDKPIPVFFNQKSDRQQRIRFILESEDNSIWMASNGSGVFRYRDGDIANFDADSGLSSNNIRALYEDNSGFIWIATEDRGLNRLDPIEGKVVEIRQSDGLFDESLHSILMDDYGTIWMSSNRGIFSVPYQQLQKFADGETGRIYSRSFTEQDGMLSREANGGFQNSGQADRDGHLYFATQHGVTVVDPTKTHTVVSLPDVIIEDVMSSGESLFNNRLSVQVKPTQRNLNIFYNKPVFYAPEKVLFQYRLKGLETEWTNAGKRREAIYTNLPAGDYIFEVMAFVDGNQEGTEASIIPIIVMPHFYETNWFYAVMGISILFLLGTGYRFRMNQLKKQQLLLETVVKNRTEALREEKKITDIQAEKLKIIDRNKSRFFANISHEFRTPLTLTIGPLTDLQKGKYGTLSQAVKKQIDLGLQNSKKVLRLVGQLMDLARLEGREFELNLKAGEVAGYIKQVAQAYNGVARQRQITYNIILPDDPVYIRFDSGHFDKIVDNVLSNAFKFTPESGTVTLQLSKNNQFAIITVEDSGYGIEPGDLSKLFDRFFQIEDSEMQPGSGIGLSLTKELTNLHGGTITVESSIGKGTRFEMKFPVLNHFNLQENKKLNRVSPSNLIESENSQENGDLAVPVVDTGKKPDLNKTVLIVDDHKEILTYLGGHISEYYSILEASSGSEARGIIEKELPDLVISDVMMANGDGYSLLQWIRGNPETDFLPVFLLTAKAEAEDKLKGLGIGADDYIVKPFDVDEVVIRISNLFKRQKKLHNYHSKRSEQNGKTFSTGADNSEEIKSADEVYLNKVYNQIQEHMHNEDFSVEDLAEKMFQSRSQLFRNLRDLSGENPSTLIKRLRLEEAAYLLQKNAGTISEVAYSVGFKSLAQFSKSFKENYQITPSQYQTEYKINS